MKIIQCRNETKQCLGLIEVDGQQSVVFSLVFKNVWGDDPLNL